MRTKKTVSGVGCRVSSDRQVRSSAFTRPGEQPPEGGTPNGAASPPATLAAPQQSAGGRHSQRGVALVITLILLSVVTFMAITFLALSRRERSAVTTVTDTASARLAADAALASAEAQVIANVLATTNPYNFTLLVSTNFISGFGYNIAVGANLTNVNYFYPNGTPVTGNDFLQNLINLYYSPRAPVFIPTNSAGANDFRFYLDLNRNGRFDGNGLVPETNNLNLPTGITNFMVGDPEWIGVLERPDAPYGPNNKFIARYAFIAVPVGNTLDLNAIHNQAHVPPRPPTPLSNPQVNPSSGVNDNFVRNEGVGSWEINLAAFLADLNTDEWGQVIGTPANGNVTFYNYLYQGQYQNWGYAFNDARALLAYRYNNNFNTLASVNNLFSPAGVAIFTSDNIDGYTYDFPLMTGFQLPGERDSLLYKLPWVGADNTNHFFSHQDLFDPTKAETGVTQPPAQPSFIEHLQQAGTNVSTYDRYTFYRLLSQLGTDTAPDSGKMNLNYDNLNPYLNGVLNTNGGVAASTNFVAWQPLAFFTNAADRLLRAYTTQWRNSNPTNFATEFYAVANFNFINADQWTNYPAFGVGNIPVLVSNQFVYSSAVNRLLQLAANIYDATTNRYYDNSLPLTPLPTVFRPFFNKVITPTATNVYICGFNEVTNINEADLPLSWPYNLADPNDLAKLVTTNHINVFGVPLIIGAKKGFPNFNEFAMQNAFQLTRKLQVTRTSPSALPNTYAYNQMFILSITNQLGVECWNSYNSDYTRPVNIFVTNYLFVTLTNDENFSTSTNFILSGNSTNSVWSGYNIYNPNPSFQIPLYQSVTAITNSMYRFNGGIPYLSSDLNLPYETNVVIGTNYPQPHWGLLVTDNIQVIMTDVASGRIIDYVQLSGPNSVRDLVSEITREYDTGSPSSDQGDDLWDTTRNNQGVPYGYVNQVGVSLGLYPAGAGSGTWDQTDPTLLQNEIDGFRAYFHLSSLPNPLSPAGAAQAIAEAQATNAMQAPYTPTATAYQHVTWQANDPLVHYIASDLQGAPGNSLDRNFNWPANLGLLNVRYMPWGGNPNLPGSDQNPYNFAIKDPLVSSSDYWDFPANKFPTVGWLGRVHRGTPWQTVFLKATNILANANGLAVWMNRTGNLNTNDAMCAAPAQDRLLFDLFTTAFNDNATRGTLSVNVGPTNANLAAWSALFSGIVVPPTSLTNSYTIISPVGTLGAGSPLWQLVNGTNGINSTRANTNLFPRQVFTHVGDILAVPALTEQSPFLNLANTSYNNDEMYEWLPQQTMSLMRASSSPRYVIYCYGQALKPAPNSIYTGGGQFFGMVTNYQVVSEIATRAVVRFGSSLTNVITSTNSVVGGILYSNWFSVPVVTNNNAVIESFNLLPPD
jgi:hypothetical protein